MPNPRFNAPVRWSFAPLLALVCLLTACAASTPPSLASYRPAPPPADLAAPCPDLGPVQDGNAQTVALWMVDAVEAYKGCAAKHSGLVRAWPK